MESSFYQFPEDLRHEFRVDNQGKVFAKSINAISRICGCAHSSIHEILNKLAVGECPSDPFKPFVGMDLRAVGEWTDLFIGACAKHFAYYAQKTNDKAKNYADFFFNYGTRGGLQHLLGWKNSQMQTGNEVAQLKTMMQQMLTMFQRQELRLEEQGKQIEEMSAKMANLTNIKENLPGIGIVFDTNNNILLPANFPPYFFARQWALIMENDDLTTSECKSFGKALADAFRLAKLENPEKIGAKAIYDKRYAQIARATYISWRKSWNERKQQLISNTAS